MNVFSGFPDGNEQTASIPMSFFDRVLPTVDHLGELKVILFFIGFLARATSDFAYLRREDFLNNREFMTGLAENPDEREVILNEALLGAVERGVLLSVDVQMDDGEERLYFINNAHGRAAVEAIQQGRWRAGGESAEPLEFLPEKANIFKLYEDNIGPITPMIAEILREAEKEYPPDQIEQAIRIAVENNARNWRYVSAVLERRKEKRKGERKDRRDTEKARRRYAEWEEL